jgi:thiol-disulfide isomerase/thioredoxin
LSLGAVIWHKTLTNNRKGLLKMFRAAFAILLFTALTAFFGMPKAARADEKSLDERGFIVTDPPQPLPAFLFEDEKGGTLNMKEFKGRYVLLNLWATFCLPCVAEMPKLDELSTKLDRTKWAIIALAEDHDGASVTRIFYKRHGINHLAIYNDRTGRAPFLLQTRGLPTTLLLNPKGEEIARLEGPADWSTDTMISYLKTGAAR